MGGGIQGGGHGQDGGGGVIARVGGGGHGQGRGAGPSVHRCIHECCRFLSR